MYICRVQLFRKRQRIKFKRFLESFMIFINSIIVVDVCCIIVFKLLYMLILILIFHIFVIRFVSISIFPVLGFRSGSASFWCATSASGSGSLKGIYSFTLCNWIIITSYISIHHTLYMIKIRYLLFELPFFLSIDLDLRSPDLKQNSIFSNLGP